MSLYMLTISQYNTCFVILEYVCNYALIGMNTLLSISFEDIRSVADNLLIMALYNETKNWRYMSISAATRDFS